MVLGSSLRYPIRLVTQAFTMVYAILAILVILAIYGPQYWVQYVMHHYAKDLEEIPGTGSQLAKHLIERYALEGVIVEETQANQDHYDPINKAVRLSPQNYHGRSLTAIAVATHEVGHAIQFYRQEPVSKLRKKYLPMALMIKKIGIGAIMLMPVLTAIVRVPQVAIILISAVFEIY